MSAVIDVRGLGKQYRIVHEPQSTNPTARDGLVNLVRAPIRRVRGRGPRHEQFWALKDLSFKVQKGEIVGIIGRNGSGKSTLLKILSRIVDPTVGEVRVRGRTSSLLEVGTGFHPELTGRENVYFNGSILGMSRREITGKFDEIVAFAEVEQFLDTPVKFYSSGMYVRLAFAVAAHLDPEILLVDEVLAVGDVQFQQKCVQRMGDVAGAGRTVLFVSHNMATIHQLCTSALVLDRGAALHGVEDVGSAVNRYLERHSSSEVTYQTGPVRRIGARQIGQAIEISADYDLPAPMSSPSIGFVISDQAGHRITGGSPFVLKHPRTEPRKAGRIVAILTEPRLLNGTYRLSVWFGDAVGDDIWNDKNCVAFDVVDMAQNANQSPADVGPVEPRCTWRVDDPPAPFENEPSPTVGVLPGLS
jgi:lipopolysaccharide transport system ATP-binding protein